jgi:hypothetical protein
MLARSVRPRVHGWHPVQSALDYWRSIYRRTHRWQPKERLSDRLVWSSRFDAGAWGWLGPTTSRPYWFTLERACMSSVSILPETAYRLSLRPLNSAYLCDERCSCLNAGDVGLYPFMGVSPTTLGRGHHRNSRPGRCQVPTSLGRQVFTGISTSFGIHPGCERCYGNLLLAIPVQPGYRVWLGVCLQPYYQVLKTTLTP